jgi:hypothetical protein
MSITDGFTIDLLFDTANHDDDDDDADDNNDDDEEEEEKEELLFARRPLPNTNDLKLLPAPATAFLLLPSSSLSSFDTRTNHRLRSP